MKSPQTEAHTDTHENRGCFKAINKQSKTLLMKKRTNLVSFILLCATIASAQVFTNKEVGKKNSEIVDSLKSADYPYALPMWGQKATNAGFDLPYSAGLSIQYFGSENSLIINNLMVGFNDGPQYDLAGIVRFDETKTVASSITFKLGIWLVLANGINT